MQTATEPRFLSLSDLPTLRTVRAIESNCAQLSRDEAILKERNLVYACKVLGIDPNVAFSHVSITSRATCDAEVVAE